LLLVVAVAVIITVLAVAVAVFCQVPQRLLPVQYIL
jgi:hypothetical protein